MKATPLIVPALIAAALVSCENPAEKTTNAATSDAVESVTPNGGDEYVISDSSTISFVGSKVTGRHDGGFKKFTGSFTVGDDGNVNGGEILIDMDSTWSDAEKLTGHLKSEDFFNVSEHPQSIFTVTKVDKTESGYDISGNLTLRGVTKNITFPATASKEGDTVKVRAEFDINRKNWDIVYAGMADDLIRDEVVIQFDLTASPEA